MKGTEKLDGEARRGRVEGRREGASRKTHGCIGSRALIPQTSFLEGKKKTITKKFRKISKGALMILFDESCLLTSVINHSKNRQQGTY